MFMLEVEKRDKIGKASKRRTGGKIPAVFYGPKETSTPISLSENDFLRVWKEAGESSVIELTGPLGKKEVLIYGVDLDPVSGRVRHADFYVIEAGKKIEVEVPIVFVGEAPAVKELGGTLVKVLHEVTVEVMPKDLPHEIPVDVSGLTDFEKHVQVRDIKLPSGVAIITDPEEVVALVSEVKEEEEAPAEAPDLDSIEVEKKGKEEETDTTEGETQES
jgi:large subunit ribosomal protein L25